MKRGLALVVAALSVALARDALAIPAFARAYDVPCSTCHLAIPRRNEFGDAFRRAGYRWPGPPEEDTNAHRQEPTSLMGVGLLDGRVPAALPLSITATFSAALATSDEDVAPEPVLGTPSLSFLLGASLGDHVSFFGTTTIRDPPDELFVHFGRFFDRRELNIKLGQLEQTTTMFKRNEALLGSFLLGSSTVDGFALSRGRLGAEANGVLFGRGFWAAGTVQNAGIGSPLDGYYHVGAKIGGMDLAGKEPDVDLDAEPSVTESLSLTLGHWGYLGRVQNTDTDEDLAHIRRLGLDAALRFDDVRVIGGVMAGWDQELTRGIRNQSVTWFVELSYAATSWLMPVYSYQYQDSNDRQEETQLFDAGLVLLILENLRGRAVLGFSADETRNETAQIQLLLGI